MEHFRNGAGLSSSSPERGCWILLCPYALDKCMNPFLLNPVPIIGKIVGNTGFSHFGRVTGVKKDPIEIENPPPGMKGLGKHVMFVAINII